MRTYADRCGGFWMAILVVAMAMRPVYAEAPPPTGGQAADESQARPAPADAGDHQARALPGIVINRQERYVDLEATVVLREGDWLEFLACAPNSKEHESIFTLKARPSHVHLALVILGLQPGSPLRWEWQGDEPIVHPATGPRVAVSIVYEKDGRSVETPAHEWIVNQKTKRNLEDSIWLFTGSRFQDMDGQRVYSADVNGTLISLVHFGDEVLARATDLTNRTDNATWGPRTRMIPDKGTKLTLRLRPVAEPADDGAAAKE